MHSIADDTTGTDLELLIETGRWKAASASTRGIADIDRGAALVAQPVQPHFEVSCQVEPKVGELSQGIERLGRLRRREIGWLGNRHHRIWRRRGRRRECGQQVLAEPVGPLSHEELARSGLPACCHQRGCRPFAQSPARNERRMEPEGETVEHPKPDHNARSRRGRLLSQCSARRDQGADGDNERYREAGHFWRGPGVSLV